MKQKALNYLIVFVILSFCIGSIYYDTKKEYKWYETMIAENSANGIVIYKNNTNVSSIYPWTWSNPPISEIIFMNKRLNGIYNSVYYAHCVSFYKQDNKTYSNIVFIDTIKKMGATYFLKVGDMLPMVSNDIFKNLKWEKYENLKESPYYGLVRNINPHFIINTFAEFKNIDKELRKGNYKINNSIGDTIIELINLRPKKLNENDYAKVKKELDKLNIDNIENIKLDSSNIKYSVTSQNFTLVDEYIINLNNGNSRYFFFDSVNEVILLND
jgi:hypothetical protein